MQILLSTRNAHKTAEVRQILPAPYTVIDLSQYEDRIPEILETGSSFLENASIKAIAGSLHFDGIVMADDSGLEVDALNGAPGVYSARYAGENADDAANRRKLREELARLGGSRHTARFRCVIALAKRGEVLASFDGSVEGVIVSEERGSNGFGYDALFIPEEYHQTFAELSSEIKNQLSHRGCALKKAVRWLEQAFEKNR